MRKLQETYYGYLPRKAKTLRQLEFFPGITPEELKEGKRSHEVIVKVVLAASQVKGL